MERMQTSDFVCVASNSVSMIFARGTDVAFVCSSGNVKEIHMPEVMEYGICLKDGIVIGSKDGNLYTFHNNEEFLRFEVDVGKIVKMEGDPLTENALMILNDMGVLYFARLDKKLEELKQNISDFAISERYALFKTSKSIECCERSASSFTKICSLESTENQSIFCHSNIGYLYNEHTMELTHFVIQESPKMTQQLAEKVWTPAIIKMGKSLLFENKAYPIEYDLIGATTSMTSLLVWRSEHDAPLQVPIFKESAKDQSVQKMEVMANQFIMNAMKLMKAGDERMMKRIQEMGAKMESALDVLRKKSDELAERVNSIKAAMPT